MKNQKGREKREGSQGTKCPESWAPCRPELPEKRQVSKKPQQLRNHANIRGSVTFPAVTQPLDGKLEPRSWRPRGTSSGRTSTECGRRPGRRLGPEPRCREPSEQDVLNSAQGPSAGRLWGWREGHPATGGLARVRSHWAGCSAPARCLGGPRKRSPTKVSPASPSGPGQAAQRPVLGAAVAP